MTAARWYAPRLDVIRFAAFALVFLGHNLARAAFLPLTITSNTAPAEVFGVIVFFVLSAYLIGRLLLIERESTSRVSVRRYWARRVLRIWPLYVTLVIGVYAIAPALRAHGHPDWLPTGSQLPYFLTFTDNWAAPIKDFPGNYLSMFWTVCVEEQIYFVFPIILLLAWRSMTGVLVAMVIAGPLSCYLVIHQGQAYPGVWNFTATHLDSFGIGLLLALADAHRGRASARWAKVRSVVVSGWGVATLLALTAAYFLVGGVVGAAFTQGYDTVVTYVSASLLAAGWVLLASESRPIDWRVTRTLAWLGRRGYGLYAWHWPVLLAVIQLQVLSSAQQLTVLGLVVSLGATVLLAAVSYRFLEMPFLRLRLRFQVVENRV